jgi:hypothetical protein
MDLILSNLKSLIGNEFNEEEIQMAFDTDEEVIVQRENDDNRKIEGQGMCKCWNAFKNVDGTNTYVIWVNKNNIIVDVKG